MTTGTPITILMADDDEDDRMFAQDALDEARVVNTMRCVENGEELMDYLHHRGKFVDTNDYPRPGLILLDLNMPKKDGREVLAEIKDDPRLKRIPVVMLSTSTAENDVLNSYDLYANCYIIKPIDLDDFVTVVKTVEDFWLSIVKLPGI